jgi:hypothetical protein
MPTRMPTSAGKENRPKAVFNDSAACRSDVMAPRNPRACEVFPTQEVASIDHQLSGPGLIPAIRPDWALHAPLVCWPYLLRADRPVSFHAAAELMALRLATEQRKHTPTARKCKATAGRKVLDLVTSHDYSTSIATHIGETK